MDTEASRIVVGVDGSESSVAALRLAARLAPALDAQVHAVLCWDFPQIYAGYVPPDFAAYEAAAARRLSEVVTKAFGTETAPDVATKLVRGPAAEKLVEEGSTAQMIVVGRRGRGGFRGLHLGSVSSACVSHADCPVVVVHEEGTHESHHQTERKARGEHTVQH
ncbi:universal stress protein [Pseudarthrobacter sp. N5]|uniref:universal stress protein n=1 Tax=Pseudarthrobacter sp. N5 TaxID=3418416 RepID=UPI003CEADD0A